MITFSKKNCRKTRDQIILKFENCANLYSKLLYLTVQDYSLIYLKNNIIKKRKNIFEYIILYL